MMVIYKTTNLVNGKYYVGKQKRYTKYYLGSGSALKFAIRKYGRHNFVKEILEVCHSSAELQCKEIEWIDILNAVEDKKSYNLVRETSSNNHRSYDDPLYREKLSLRVKEAMRRPEIYAKLLRNNRGENNPMFGKCRPRSFKRMVSKLHKGKILSSETKSLISIKHLGLRASNETKAKMSRSQLKRWDIIRVKCTLGTKTYTFNTRREFISFIQNYNQQIPRGRVRGRGAKRINWKRALMGEYPFITTTLK